jgi:hypothetical protein
MGDISLLDATSPMLRRAFKGRSQLAEDIRHHVVRFIVALRRDDQYGAAVYHQEAMELLDRYARQPAQRRFLRQVAAGKADRRGGRSANNQKGP